MKQIEFKENSSNFSHNQDPKERPITAQSNYLIKENDDLKAQY